MQNLTKIYTKFNRISTTFIQNFNRNFTEIQQNLYKILTEILTEF